LKQAVLNVINSNNPECFKSIDITQFKSANINQGDATPEKLNKLPKNLLFSFAQQQKPIADLDSTNCQNYPLNGASIKDLQQLSNKSNVIDMVSNMNTDEMNSFRVCSNSHKYLIVDLIHCYI
jgi:hypothetical protein